MSDNKNHEKKDYIVQYKRKFFDPSKPMPFFKISYMQEFEIDAVDEKEAVQSVMDAVLDEACFEGCRVIKANKDYIVMSAERTEEVDITVMYYDFAASERDIYRDIAHDEDEKSLLITFSSTQNHTDGEYEENIEVMVFPTGYGAKRYLSSLNEQPGMKRIGANKVQKFNAALDSLFYAAAYRESNIRYGLDGVSREIMVITHDNSGIEVNFYPTTEEAENDMRSVFMNFEDTHEMVKVYEYDDYDRKIQSGTDYLIQTAFNMNELFQTPAFKKNLSHEVENDKKKSKRAKSKSI